MGKSSLVLLSSIACSFLFSPLAHADVFTPGDADGDGLTDAYEWRISHTDPYNQDTDGDDVSDYAEIFIYGTNPHDVDSDDDGLNDDQEVFYRHTNPNDPDSDHDGYSDYIEWQAGTNPTDRFSHPWRLFPM